MSHGGGVLGLFRRWFGGRGSEMSVSTVEELFGPGRRDARQRVQEQAQAAEAAPAPGDRPTHHDPLRQSPDPDSPRRDRSGPAGSVK